MLIAGMGVYVGLSLKILITPSADENLQEQRRSTISGGKPTPKLGPKPTPKPVVPDNNVLAEAGYKPRPAKVSDIAGFKVNQIFQLN